MDIIVPRGDSKEVIKVRELEHLCPGMGLVKLTVGVMRRMHDKVQYCITAIESETRKAPVKDADLCPGNTQ